jgi:hypothetical protein
MVLSKPFLLFQKILLIGFYISIDGVYWEDEQADRQVLNEKTGAINSVFVL